MRPLTVLALWQMCAAQDPQFRDSAFGHSLESRPSFMGWKAFDQRPLSQCLRTRKWLPNELCASVMSLNTGDREEFDSWWYEHLDTLQTLGPVFDYFDKAGGDSTAACPDVAPQKKSPPRPPAISIERVDLIWAGEYAGKVGMVPDVTLVKNTDRIAAAVGVHFGIYFNVVSTPAEGILTVQYKISVPEPGLSDGYASERQLVVRDRPQCVLGKPCLVGFVFGTEGEIVPGKWQLKVSFHGKTLIEHEFEVYRKEDMAFLRARRVIGATG